MDGVRALKWKHRHLAALEDAEHHLDALRRQLEAGDTLRPMLPVGFLTGALWRDDVSQPLTDLIFSIAATDIDDRDANGVWPRRPEMHCTIRVLWQSPERWFQLHVPSARVGLGTETSVTLTTDPDAKHTVQRFEASALGDGAYDVELSATLDDGSHWRMAARGRPQFVDASTLEPGAEAAGRALLQRLLPEGDWLTGRIERTPLKVGDNAFVRLAWQPAWLESALQLRWQQQRQHALAERATREAAEAERLAMLRAQPIPQPTDTLPLVAGRNAYALRRGALQLRVDASGLAHALSLDLVPDDDDAGGDGGLCPSCFWSGEPWSIAQPLEGQWQTLELPDADAWFGSDAPSLDTNRLTWRRISTTQAEVVWSAEYEDWHLTRQTERLEFKGLVTFTQVTS